MVVPSCSTVPMIEPLPVETSKPATRRLPISGRILRSTSTRLKYIVVTGWPATAGRDARVTPASENRPGTQLRDTPEMVTSYLPLRLSISLSRTRSYGNVRWMA